MHIARPTTSTLNLKIPATPRCSGLARKKVAAFAAEQRLDPDGAREFVAAIGEALANAIEHSRSRVVEIACWVEGSEKLIATVVDSGCGFSVVPEGPVHLPPPHAERGRGLPIMRRYSDVFSVHTELGRGTTVVLGRKLRPATN
ncbi:MAG TPA: ATP-binding protein [Candidatus Acidoferrales bacterium]|nr:ATP-binding protein [Candidatus Acidoferrales bacterium]